MGQARCCSRNTREHLSSRAARVASHGRDETIYHELKKWTLQMDLQCAMPRKRRRC